MLRYHRNHLLLKKFGDKSRFCSDPDNQCHWIPKDKYREEMCAKYEKYKFGATVWATIGYRFKSKLVFPRGKNTAKSYR